LRSRKRFAGAVALAAIGIGVLAAGASANTLVVLPGHSIQAKINRAHPGDTVIVSAGTYRESLALSKGIRLEGQGSFLKQPAHPAKSLCNQGGDVVGICVTGRIKVGQNGQPKIVHRVGNVRISGFRIRGFKGEGIFAYGTRGMRVKNNRLIKNGDYGVFSLSGVGTRYIDNIASGSGEAGFYIGDSKNARAFVHGNRSANSMEGIFLRHSNNITASGNVLAGNCVGLLALADAPGPAGNMRIAGNRVIANNKGCGGGSEGPPLSGLGIALFGAHDVIVTGNVVRQQRSLHKSVASAGIAVGKGLGGTPPKHDLISGNVSLGNRPLDILWDRSGTVAFHSNACRRSNPGFIC
jgi:nitrous oxidase accessory protein NosD